MIIKLIPETDEERSRFKETFSSYEISHEGVREFFIFGNKSINNDQLVDFHEWAGSPRYLMGNLRYFFEVVNDERRMKDSYNRNINQAHKNNKIEFPKNETKNDENNITDIPNTKEEVSKISENIFPKIIKKGEISPDIQTINIDNLNRYNENASKEPKIINISELKGKVTSILDEDPIPSVPKIDFPNHFQR
jgi:hypothetical protein